MYDIRARATAARSLAPKERGGKGLAVVITGPGGTYNEATQKTTPGTATVINGSGVQFSYTVKQVDGEKIKTGDKRVMLSALDEDGNVIVDPQIGWIYEDGTGKYEIVFVELFAPAGLTIYYWLQIRGK